MVFKYPQYKLFLENEVTFIIKTFDRSKALRRLLTSINNFYPKTRTIIVNDGSQHLDYSETFENAIFINTEFDVGLSAGRNIALDNVETPYFILLDDDHVLTKNTDFTILSKILFEDDFDIVCGTYHNYINGMDKGLHYWHGNIYEQGNLLDLVNVPIPKDKEFVKCDIAPNLFLANTDVIRNHNRWDDRLKIKGEHIQFFLDFKRSGYKTAFTDKVICNHVKNKIDDDLYYSKYRQRKNPDEDGLYIFMSSYGFDYYNKFGSLCILNNEKQEARQLSYKKSQETLKEIKQNGKVSEKKEPTNPQTDKKVKGKKNERIMKTSSGKKITPGKKNK